MFWGDNALWLAIRRVKSENRIGKETFIPSKCYPALTNLFKCYLLIVQPIKADFVNLVRGPKQYHVYMEYLWTNGGNTVTDDMMKAIATNTLIAT